MSVSEAPDICDEHRDTGQWRTVAPLLLLPENGRVRLLSPRASKRIVVTTKIAQFLLAAQNGYPKQPGEIPAGWRDREFQVVSRTLASYGYLVGDEDHGEEETPWRSWGPLAWAYHDAITNPSKVDADTVAERSTRSRPSSFRRPADEPILLLPRLSPRSKKSFIDVLEQRRTHRDFVSARIATEEFADILRYSFGPLRYVDGGPLGVMQLRAAASGGARHETEAYVYVFNVENVEAGLYAYDGLRHGLVPLRSGVLRDEIERLTLDQGFFREAAFGVITVALSERMSWKYQNASAYRVIWQNVGHAAQIFSMMCASVGLGASLTGAIRVPDAKECLGLRSESELVTFAMACGKPEVAGDGLPTSIRVPNAPFTV